MYILLVDSFSPYFPHLLEMRVSLAEVCSTVAMLIKSGKTERDELMKRQVWATVINCLLICMFMFGYTGS